MVVPGKYMARLTVDGHILEQSFELLPDPRLKDTNTELDDIQKQFDFTMKLQTLLDEARKQENSLNSELNKLKKGDMVAKEQRLSIERALEKLRKKDIIYPQPKIIDQMEYLYYMTNGADQMMGKDAYNQLENLETQYHMVVEELGSEK